MRGSKTADRGAFHSFCRLDLRDLLYSIADIIYSIRTILPRGIWITKRGFPKVINTKLRSLSGQDVIMKSPKSTDPRMRCVVFLP